MKVNIAWFWVALMIVGALTVGYFISNWYAQMRTKRDLEIALDDAEEVALQVQTDTALVA